MHLRVSVLLAVALTLNSSAASAQSSPRERHVIAPGDRIRLMLSLDEARRSGRGLVSGSLVSGDSVRVVVMRRDGSRADTIPSFTIDDVELYTGQRSRAKMIFAGATAGAAASGLVYGIDRFSRAHRCSARKECVPLLPFGYYAVPIAVGAVFGGTFSASRWVRVPRQALYRVGFRNSRSIELSAAVRFR